jgi:ribosomal protein L34E
MDNVKAPNCPVCGKFMDKVEVSVLQQLSESGTAVEDRPYVGWVCVPCNK